MACLPQFGMRKRVLAHNSSPAWVDHRRCRFIYRLNHRDTYVIWCSATAGFVLKLINILTHRPPARKDLQLDPKYQTVWGHGIWREESFIFFLVYLCL